MRIPKINSNGYAGKWIGVSLLIGVAVPFILWLIFDKVFWVFAVIGGLSLFAFIVIFVIEMRQDSAKVPYYEKDLENRITYNPQKQYAIIRSSICTGEKVAGFKDRENGHFTEIMVIRTQADEERFKKMYDIDSIKTEY